MINKKNILLVALFVAHVSVGATSTVQLNVFKNTPSSPSSPADTPDALQPKADSVEKENQAEEPVVKTPQGNSGASPEAGKDSAAPNNGATKTDNPVVAPQGNPNASSVVLEIKELGEDKPGANSKAKSDSRVSQDANKGMFASFGAYCSGAVGGASAAVTAHPVLAVAGGAAIIAAVIWTVYAHKTTQRAKTLDEELDELESF